MGNFALAVIKDKVIKKTKMNKKLTRRNEKKFFCGPSYIAEELRQ